MLAVFIGGGIMDGRELEVQQPKSVLVFPLPIPPLPLSPDDECVRCVRVPTDVYRLASDRRYQAIKHSVPTPSFIKAQLSDASILYEYTGRKDG